MVASVKPPKAMASLPLRRPAGSSVLTDQTQIVLVGNPNVGKSAIFNALTGMSADVSNYPGTTIDVSRGKIGANEVIDTPGIYGVSSFNDEERIARKIIVDADLIINVVSALSLDRDLFLTVQLAALGKPMLVVINQWDEAEYRKLKIDTDTLSEALGVPVLHSVAVRNEGISEIIAALPTATTGNIAPELSALLAPFLEKGLPQHLSLLALEGDAASAERLDCPVPDVRVAIYKARRLQVNDLYDRCLVQNGSRQTLSNRIGRFLLHPVWGTITSIAVCYLIFYQLLGIWIAGNVVDITEKQGMRVYYEPTVRRLAASVFPCDVVIADRTYHFPHGTMSDATTAKSFDTARTTVRADKVQYNFWSYHNLVGLIGNALVGEYGVVTLTVTYLLGLLLPLVLGFYLGLSLLEDSGYLPRLAVLVDRLLNKVGLNGRAIIPLILGLGCVTMATVTTRLLSTRREKIIATALLGVAIPCSAQLGIVSGTLAKAGGLASWVVYGTVVGGMLAAVGLLLNMVMPGKSQGLMIDLPPMRMPRARNVLKKTWTKSWNFMEESLPMFCLAGLVVTIGQVTGLLDAFIRVLQPITVSWLHLPNDPRIATTFILGIVRRDFAAFGLTDVPLTPAQAVIAMIVITLFVPCVATVGVMMKERGPKIAMSIWIGSWLCAFVVGGALAQFLPALFSLTGP